MTIIDSAIFPRLSLIAIVTAGCSTFVEEGQRLTPDDEHGYHIVAADVAGGMETAIYKNDYKCQNGHGSTVTPHTTTAFANCQLNSVIAAIDTFANGPDSARCGRRERKIVLFIHGGLNVTSTKRADADFADALEHCIYVVYMNWESGFGPSYRDHIMNIRFGKRINDDDDLAFFERSMFPVTVTVDVVGGIVRFPVTYWRNLRLSKNMYLNQNDRAIINDHSYRGREHWCDIDASNNVIIAGNTDRGFRISEWLGVGNPLKLATYPFVDGIGRPSWNNMQRRTYAVFRPDSDFLDFENRNCLIARNGGACGEISESERDQIAGGSGVFAEFARQLSISQRDWPTEVELYLSAHSMGAIIANELVANFDIRFAGIAYLAGASSIKHFQQTVIPYLLLHPDARFYNVTLHPDADNREVNYLGAAPGGSLLAWIDDLYEDTDADIDRTLGRWDNMRGAKWTITEDIQERMVFKIYSDEGPQKHGEFTLTYIADDGEITYAYWYPPSWSEREMFDWDSSDPVPPTRGFRTPTCPEQEEAAAIVASQE